MAGDLDSAAALRIKGEGGAGGDPRAATPPHAYIPEIDGLRAIAVVAVILYHARSRLLPGGFSGVDVFFVISGYVVSASLARESSRRLSAFALRFYARRMVRILPALVVCLAATAVASTLFIPASWLSHTSTLTAIAAFFGASNVVLTFLNDGYFAPRAEYNSFTHTWSLGVEEQFYLVFPLLFFAWLKSRGRGTPAGRALGLLLPLLFVSSLLFSWHQTRSAPAHAYYLLPSRFWELAAGALLFRLQAGRRFAAASRAAAGLAVPAGLAMACLGFALARQRAFPFPWALLSVGGSALVIAGVTGSLRQGSLAARTLGSRPLAYVGRISYSLYLWHWPVFVLFRWTTGLQEPAHVAAAVALTAGISALSYRYIETPTRKGLLAAMGTDRRTVLFGCAAIAAGVALCTVVFKAQPVLSLSTTRDSRIWYPYAWPGDRAARSPGGPSLHGRTLFAVGDSHAGAYETMFELLKADYGVETRQMFTGGSPVADLIAVPTPDRTQGTLTELEKIAKPGDIVFLASLRVERLGDQWGAFPMPEVEARRRSAVAVTRRAEALRYADELITRLEKRGLIVLIDAPKPIFRAPPFRCSDWFNARNPVCEGGFSMDRDYLLDYRRPVMDSLEELSRRHGRLLVWDPFPVLCPTATCSAFDGRKPLFFDGDHLSAHGNRVLYPSFRDLVVSAWTAAAR